MNYFIMFDGQVIGPMSKEQLIAYGVNPQTQVCEGKDGQWRPLYTYPELMELLPAQAPDNRKLVTALLAIFLGSFGIQYFYLGKTKAGIFSILLTVVTCGIWGIIPFIQGILMLIMNDADFNRKYVNTASTFPVF